MSTCVVRLGWDAPQCGKEAIAIAELGCVHEHLDDAPVCAMHEITTRANYVQSGWVCIPCGNAGHECKSRLTIRPLSGVELPA